MKEKFTNEEKFVADYIEREKEQGYTLFGAYTHLEHIKDKDYRGHVRYPDELRDLKVYEWLIDGNQERLARGWFGYEIEEEKYVVPTTPLDDDNMRAYLSKEDEWDLISDKDAETRENLHFTMDEIEAISRETGKDYTQFARKVE